MDGDKQPTPIGPINLAIRWPIALPTATRHSPDKVMQRRWIERRYGGGTYHNLRNYWHALDEPVRSILEVVK